MRRRIEYGRIDVVSVPYSLSQVLIASAKPPKMLNGLSSLRSAYLGDKPIKPANGRT